MENLFGFAVMAGLIFVPVPTLYFLFWLLVFWLLYRGALWSGQKIETAGLYGVTLMLLPLVKFYT